MFFNIDFWRNFLILVLGIPAGIGTTLLCDYIFFRPARIEEERQRRVTLLEALRDTIRRNCIYRDGFRKMLEVSDQLTHAGFDATALDSLASDYHNTLKNMPLSTELDRLRFMMRSFNNVLETLFSIEFDASSYTCRLDISNGTQMSFCGFYSPRLREQAKRVLEPISEKLDALQQELENQLPKKA